MLIGGVYGLSKRKGMNSVIQLIHLFFLLKKNIIINVSLSCRIYIKANVVGKRGRNYVHFGIKNKKL